MVDGNSVSSGSLGAAWWQLWNSLLYHRSLLTSTAESEVDVEWCGSLGVSYFYHTDKLSENEVDGGGLGGFSGISTEEALEQLTLSTQVC